MGKKYPVIACAPPSPLLFEDMPMPHEEYEHEEKDSLLGQYYSKIRHFRVKMDFFQAHRAHWCDYCGKGIRTGQYGIIYTWHFSFFLCIPCAIEYGWVGVPEQRWEFVYRLNEQEDHTLVPSLWYISLRVLDCHLWSREDLMDKDKQAWRIYRKYGGSPDLPEDYEMYMMNGIDKQESFQRFMQACADDDKQKETANAEQ
jgi:hypothetical protein